MYMESRPAQLAGISLERSGAPGYTAQLTRLKIGNFKRMKPQDQASLGNALDRARKIKHLLSNLSS